MRVKQFIALSRKATTVEELCSLMREALCDLGIEQTIVRLMVVTALVGLPDCDLLVSDVDEWPNNSHHLKYKSYHLSQSTIVAGSSAFHEVPDTRSAEIEQKEAETGQRIRISIPLGKSPGATTAVILQSAADIVLDEHSLDHISRLAREFHRIYWSPQVQKRDSENVCLSAREQEVLQWCAQGKSRDNISGILKISRNTVDYHLRNIYRKLDTGNVTVAVVKALQHGLIKI